MVNEASVAGHLRTIGETEVLPDAGHIHTHHGWWPYKEPWAPDMTRCRHSVHDGGRGCGFHQCNRKVKITRKVLHHGKEAEFGYCATHDPVAVAAKNAKWRADFDAKMEAERAERAAKVAAKQLAERAIDALRQIAAGHNDPRSLAIEVLNGTPAPSGAIL